ncbi:MAG: response regulator transcription factor, partial [Polaromonas sp.]
MPESIAAPPIQVAFVEDDLFFAEAFADALEGQPDMRLQAVAASCAEARAMLRTPAAQVLLVDLGLPDGSGLDIIREAQQLWPNCHVMVSTVFGDETHVIQSLEAGATGYLLKDSTPERIINEIRSVHAGGSPISPLIARQLLTRFRHAFSADSVPMPLLPADGPDSPSDGQARLSPRER